LTKTKSRLETKKFSSVELNEPGEKKKIDETRTLQLNGPVREEYLLQEERADVIQR